MNINNHDDLQSRHKLFEYSSIDSKKNNNNNMIFLPRWREFIALEDCPLQKKKLVNKIP